MLPLNTEPLYINKAFKFVVTLNSEFGKKISTKRVSSLKSKSYFQTPDLVLWVFRMIWYFYVNGNECNMRHLESVTFWSTMEHAISRTCARLNSPESSSTGSRLKPIWIWKEMPCDPGRGLGGRITGGTLIWIPWCQHTSTPGVWTAIRSGCLIEFTHRLRKLRQNFRSLKTFRG